MATILDLYTQMAGKSETPAIFHRWMCLALMAASLEDRVSVTVIKEQPLKPQLFVGLIADGSVGKGVAVGMAKSLAKARPADGRYQGGREISIYSGRITYSALLSKLMTNTIVEPSGLIITKPVMWLLMEELGSGLTNEKNVDPFIKLVTDLYTSCNSEFMDDTTSRGSNVIKKPCLNWTFCSTSVWLKDILNRSTMDSGFVARTIFVFGEESSERMMEPIYPDNYESLREEVLKRIFYLRCWEGEFEVEPAVKEFVENWYISRPEPTEQLLKTTWKRQKEFFWRFAMLGAANRCEDMVIKFEDALFAIELIDEMFQGAGRILSIAAETKETKPINEIEVFLQTYQQAASNELMEYMRKNRGYNAKTVRAAMDELISTGKVTASSGAHNRKTYFWSERNLNAETFEEY